MHASPAPKPLKRPQDTERSPLSIPLSPPARFEGAWDAGNHAFVTSARQQIQDIVSGVDRRLLVVVGPCSIDHPGAAVEYARELRRIQDETADALLLCMRTYFEKPRTTVGWKGWFSDPHADGSMDVEYGLRTGVELLRQLTEMRVPTAVELLDPLFAAYVARWVSWAAVGARTTESQVHRQTVSSLPFPVGFKNGTDGGVDVAVAAMQSAAAAHTFPSVCDGGRLQLVRSLGNPSTHVVLRGGAQGVNYDELSVARVHQKLVDAAVANTRVMVDCSHGNSNKDYRNQPRVVDVVAQQVASGGPIFGLMLESYLIAGNQPAVPLAQRRVGQSQTDGCIDLVTTAQTLTQLAGAVRQRNAAT